MTINIENYLNEVETGYLVAELVERTDFSVDDKNALSKFCDEEFGKELDDYDTDELIEELSIRSLSNNDREEILEFVKVETISDEFDLYSLADKMKYEVFRDNFDKISLTQLESIINA